MALSDPLLIPAGTEFTPDELIFYADRDHRSLDEALAEADLLVTCPHSGALIPAEVAAFLAPEFTRRAQFDFTDCSTGPVVRRWAEIDPRVVCVENPHPRMVRDPDRPRPDDLYADLVEAFARVRAAGPLHDVDLTGVDAVRPVTFSNLPLLTDPGDAAGVRLLAHTFADVAARGVDVYERTRDDLLGRMVEAAFTEARESGRPVRFTTLSFHDTMNATTAPDGAVNIERDPADRLPGVVALSNRGGRDGGPEGGDAVTMAPERIRALADAHRTGFAVDDTEAVTLNRPSHGGREIVSAAELFAGLVPRAADAGVTLDAVQAEFHREFLLGPVLTAELREPGVGWPKADPDQVDSIARACKASWDAYRAG